MQQMNIEEVKTHLSGLVEAALQRTRHTAAAPLTFVRSTEPFRSSAGRHKWKGQP